MKRFLSLIFVIAITVIIVGCSNVDFEDEYGVDEKVLISNTIVKDDAIEILQNAKNNLNNAVKMSIEMEANLVGREEGQSYAISVDAEAKFDLSNSNNKLMSYESDFEQSEVETKRDLYRKDNYVYVYEEIAGAINKYKVSEQQGAYLVNNEISTLIEFGIEGIDEAIEELLDDDPEILFGKDREGNYVFQTAEKFNYGENFRLVIKDNKLRYVCITEISDSKRAETEVKYIYKSPKFEFPRNLNDYIEQLN